MHSERLQVLVSVEQKRSLQQQAKEQGTSVGAVIRSAIEEKYQRGSRRSPEVAFTKLLSHSAPVSDWPDMKKEIIESRF